MSRIPFIDRSVRLAITIVGFPLSICQTMLSYYHLYKNKPIGKHVRVGQRALHAVVTGGNNQGNPTIILESGMGGCSLDWSLIQSELSKNSMVLSYDRAGFCWSTQTMVQPTCKNDVNELRLLLKEMNLKPPYLLVGHSYGGMIMRLFASEYPEEVKGLILVDSTHEDRYLTNIMSESRRTEREKNLKVLRLGYLLSPIGIPRILKRHIGANRLPSDVQTIVTSLGRRNNAFKAAYLELLCAEESANQLKNAPPLRHDMPVIVLSAGKQNDDWKKGQEALLNLTERTKQIMVEESWHSIQIHQPDVVVDAVKSLLS